MEKFRGWENYFEMRLFSISCAPPKEEVMPCRSSWNNQKIHLQLLLSTRVSGPVLLCWGEYSPGCRGVLFRVYTWLSSSQKNNVDSVLLCAATCSGWFFSINNYPNVGFWLLFIIYFLIPLVFWPFWLLITFLLSEKFWFFYSISTSLLPCISSAL